MYVCVCMCVMCMSVPILGYRIVESAVSKSNVEQSVKVTLKTVKSSLCVTNNNNRKSRIFLKQLNKKDKTNKY